MNNPMQRCLTLVLALLLGALVMTACSPDPQEQYEDATQALKEARDARNEAQEALNDKKEELSDLRDNLNESEKELKQARQKVEQASQAVDKTVTDEVLFRTVQRELLDKKRFDESAISVGVQDRVVTLTGNVPDEKTHRKALEVTRAQAGVKKVVDSINVQEAKKDKDKEQKPQSQKDNKKGDQKPAPDQKDARAAPDGGGGQ